MTLLSHQPDKAYKNLNFLNSPAARHIRILCEYEETRQRFLRHGIRDTLVFFGSARARPVDVAAAELKDARAAVAEAPDSAEAKGHLALCQRMVRLSRYYDDARELAARLARWSENREGKSYCIASGGGPGIMEAANRGAADVGAMTAGLGISLPFEQGVNRYVSQELAFEFHYFFTRKYWFLYLCQAMVIFPGGFGTMDELFETLTLVQTNKIKRRLPVVFFGTDYWDRVIDMGAMAEFGTISPPDLELVHRTDDVGKAYEFIVNALVAAEVRRRKA